MDELLGNGAYYTRWTAALLDVLIPVLAACTPLPKPRKKKAKA